MMLMTSRGGGNPTDSHKIRREHGLQLPLHPLQLTGWLGVIGLAAGSFLLLIPVLPERFQISALAPLSAVLLFHLAAHLGTCLVDPAEPALRYVKPTPLPLLDRTKYPHVIENGNCHLCCIVISGPRTKHCSSCNKCVADFDHHCKWLNQCVGGRNYASFLMCVSTAVIASIIIAILAIAELYIHQTNPDFLLSSSSFSNATTGTRNPDQFATIISNDFVFVAIVSVIALLAVISAGLLLHLCFFHIYISFLGLTTYEYIREQKSQNSNSTPAMVHATETIENVKKICPNLKLNYEKRSQVAAIFSSCVTCSDEINESGTAIIKGVNRTGENNCLVCVTSTNVVSPAPASADGTVTDKKRLRQRWNCCTSGIPDSPEDPVSPGEPRCLINLCRYKVKRKRNVSSSNGLEGRRSPNNGLWTSAKIRVLFRIINNLRQNRRKNQQQTPSPKKKQISPVKDGNVQPHIQTVSNLIPIPSYLPPSTDRKTLPLPTLPPLPKKRIITETELANALGALQQPQQSFQRTTTFRRLAPHYRRRKRSFSLRPKSPALSPIRESGLSNPASPSHQQYTVPNLNNVL